MAMGRGLQGEESGVFSRESSEGRSIDCLDFLFDAIKWA